MLEQKFHLGQEIAKESVLAWLEKGPPVRCVRLITEIIESHRILERDYTEYRKQAILGLATERRLRAAREDHCDNLQRRAERADVRWHKALKEIEKLKADLDTDA